MPKVTLSLSPKLMALIDKYKSMWTDGNNETGAVPYTIHEAFERMDAQFQADWARFDGFLFTAGERDLMLNNALSTSYNVASIPGAVEADTYDEEDSIFEAYGVDKEALLKKLRGLTIGEQYSLVSWLEYMRSRIK